MAQRDPLDRAFADLEAVMLAQFQRDPGEGIVRREIHDRPLQRPRTPARTDLRAENKGAHAVVSEPVLRLYDRDFAEFRVPAEFFLPWRCIAGLAANVPSPSPRPGSRPNLATPRGLKAASPRRAALPPRRPPSGRPRRIRPPPRSMSCACEARDALASPQSAPHRSNPRHPSAPSIRILPPNQSKPNLPCIALNRTPTRAGAVDSELTWPVLVAHQMSASSVFVPVGGVGKS